MKRKRISLLSLCFFILTVSLYSQSGKYVVFSFQDSYKITAHKPIIFCWITWQDSIRSKDFEMCHLFVGLLSTKDFLDCQKGIPIDPSIMFNDPSDTVDLNRTNQNEVLKSLLLNNRKLVMTVTKKWPNGQEEKVSIYATPLVGDFCFTKLHPIRVELTNYQGRVAIPVSNFSFDTEFWKKPISKYVLQRDFSKFDFDIIQF